MYRSARTILALAVSLTACSNYQISVNEQIVYEPPKLFSEYSIKDRELKECVRNSIEEQNITAASQLEILTCSGGGIESLDGLETFTKLTTLGLAGNAISDISGLESSTKLRYLNLENNKLKNLSPLNELESLEFLSVKSNPGLNCWHVKRALFSVRIMELACDE